MKQIQFGGKNSQCIQTGGSMNLSGEVTKGYQSVSINGVKVEIKGKKVFINGINFDTKKPVKGWIKTTTASFLCTVAFFSGMACMALLYRGM